jgi:hypothetical protein
MYDFRRLGPALLLSALTGCAGPDLPTAKPGDPKAVEALEAHCTALRHGDWRAAHNQLHPDLRAMINLRKFTDFHSRRRKSVDFPRAIEVVNSETSGHEVNISFDALYAPPGGGSAVAVPPHRKVTLRKSGDSWKLMTHDVLAVTR